ncbi:hypothetical protein FSOLCH5_013408 [Fusarium solani]
MIHCRIGLTSSLQPHPLARGLARRRPLVLLDAQYKSPALPSPPVALPRLPSRLLFLASSTMASTFPRRPPSYFATENNQLPLLAGKLKNPGKADKFIAPDELHLLDLPRLYRQQPALFQPRDEWDTSTTPSAAGAAMPALDDSPQLIMRKFSGRQRSCFPPPQGWDISWGEHVCRLWKLWVDIDKELIIYDAAVKPNSHFGMSQGRPFHDKSPYLAGYHDKVSCDAKLGFSTPLEFRRAMHGKRFLVGIIHFHSIPHFTTFIFDRARAHFYHFDTLGDQPYVTPGADQVGRMRCAVLAMRETLMWAGQPFFFDFFGVPVSEQPRGWECGILSVFCLFLTLRGLVGNQYDDVDIKYRSRPVAIEGQDHMGGIVRHLELPMRDWILVKGGDPVLSRDRISAWFQRVIMDELGVPGARCLKKGKNPSTTYSGKHANLIKCPGDDLSSSRLPIQQLYTSLGGYQPIAFDNVELTYAWPGDRLLKLPATHGTGSYRRSHAADPGGVFVVPEMSVLAKTWYNDRGVQIEGNLPCQPRPRVDHVDLSALEATPPPPPGTPSRTGIDATPRGTPAQPKTPASRVSARPPPAETPSLGLRGLSIQTPTKPAGAQSSTPSKPAKASAAPSPGPSAEDHPLPAPKVFKTRLVVEVPGPSSKWNTPSPVASASRNSRSPASPLNDSPGSLGPGRDHQRAPSAGSPATAVMTWSAVASRSGSPMSTSSRHTAGPGQGSLRSGQSTRSAAPGSPGGSAYSPSTTSSPLAESEAPALPRTRPASSRLADPVPRRRMRPAVDSPPPIWNAEQVPCDEVAQQQGSAGNIGDGANIMSRIPGTSVELARVEGRMTTVLTNGCFATHVPSGMVSMEQWIQIMEAAERPFRPQVAQAESRDERMRRRQEARGDGRQ